MQYEMHQINMKFQAKLYEANQYTHVFLCCEGRQGVVLVELDLIGPNHNLDC